MQAGWYIDGESATASEVRRVLRAGAGRTWAPSEALDRYRSELREGAYTDVDGVAVEIVYPLSAETWDDRDELVLPVVCDAHELVRGGRVQA